jgi:hypothetical protein
MQPFIEIPQVIVNNEQKEKEVTTRLQPSQIEYYYPGFYSGSIICLKSQNSLFTTLSVEEIDAALIAYHNFIRKNTGKFGNLNITPKLIREELLTQ